jgi:hypothetical protein
MVTSCRKPRKTPIVTRAQQQRIENSKLKAMPEPDIKFDVRFNDHIELIGIDIKPKTVAPGGRMTVIWYWKCLKDSPEGWKIFVHFDGAGQRRTFDHHAVEGSFPIKKWKAGEIIRDEQALPLDSRFPEGKASLYVGIYDDIAWKERKENKRMEIRVGLSKRPIKEDRFKVANVQVSKTGLKKNTDYKLSLVTEAPKIDGKADDTVWRNARWTPWFKRPNGKRLNPKIRTRAKLLYDQAALYVFFETYDADIKNPGDKRDDQLWRSDVVELYLDPGHDTKNYLEFQFAPTGALFDALFTSHRKPDWRKAAPNFDMSGIEMKVHLKGTLNQSDDQDQGWSVEVRIPFTELPGVSATPKPGTRWGFNLYRIDSDAPSSGASMGAFAPVGGDFHNLKDAGTLVFGTQGKKPSKTESQPREKPKPQPTTGPAPKPSKALLRAPSPAVRLPARSAPVTAPSKAPQPKVEGSP